MVRKMKIIKKVGVTDAEILKKIGQGDQKGFQ